MKKLMSIITMLLVVIGISGCGSSLPTEINVEQTSGFHEYVVGEDIAPGKYKVICENLDNKGLIVITTQGSNIYDQIKNRQTFDYESYAKTEFELKKDEILFVGYVEGMGEVKIEKE